MSASAPAQRILQHSRNSREGRRHRVTAALVLATIATPAFALASPMHSGRAEAHAAKALVAQLRDMPLPRRPVSRRISASRATPPSLPALEVRRQRLYRQLHALGPASVTALAQALHDPDPRMRRDAAVALDVLGGGWWHFPDGSRKLDLRPALPALLRALQDPNPSVRAWAAQDLSDMGAAAATAVAPLRALLRRSDAESRGSACRALGHIGPAASIALPDLSRALQDSSPAVRRAASDAIARIQRADALGAAAPPDDSRP